MTDSVRFLTRRIDPARDGAGSGAVLHAIGSRSEAVRLAAVVDALRSAGVPQEVASLQSADGDVFDFTGVPRTEALVMPSGATDVQRTAVALAAAEKTLNERTPSMLVLAGDADSTLAFGLAASKLGIPIVRIGAGLRCGDFSLSEEINRILSDRLAEVLFADSQEAVDALDIEGVAGRHVRCTGNTAVDLLRRCEVEALRIASFKRFGLRAGEYVLVTLHRPENVRDEARTREIAEALAALARRHDVIVPLHPATRALMEARGDIERLQSAGVRLGPPLGYLDFLSLEQSAGAILTDSGGVQEEASALGVRCYTLRRFTERIATLTYGTNVLLGDDPAEIASVRIDGPVPAAAIPLWDGRAAQRVAVAMSESLLARAA
jgi:UDP-N-acetylglucosamine 2-epimerase (non-hydrolysing)